MYRNRLDGTWETYLPLQLLGRRRRCQYSLLWVGGRDDRSAAATPFETVEAPQFLAAAVLKMDLKRGVRGAALVVRVLKRWRVRRAGYEGLTVTEIETRRWRPRPQVMGK